MRYQRKIRIDLMIRKVMESSKFSLQISRLIWNSQGDRYRKDCGLGLEYLPFIADPKIQSTIEMRS